MSRGGLPGRAQKDTALVPAARTNAEPGREWASPRSCSVLRSPPGTNGAGVRASPPAPAFTREGAVGTARSLGRSEGSCARACVWCWGWDGNVRSYQVQRRRNLPPESFSRFPGPRVCLSGTPAGGSARAAEWQRPTCCWRAGGLGVWGRRPG